MIDSAALAKAIRQPEDGAVAIFEGVVRNQTRGRRTLYLDYEAYEEMALKQMEELAERALADFKIRDVAIVHRLGRLEIGETSVLIAVSSPHRAAAFDACRCSSTPSSAPCPSGRRNISKMAPSGLTANRSRPIFPALKAPIPGSVHLSDKPFSLWPRRVEVAEKHLKLPDEASFNCWPALGPVAHLSCPRSLTPLSKSTSSW